MSGGRRRWVVRDEAGIGLAEVLAATIVLMVVVVSLTNVMIDSLRTTLLSRQRSTASSIASGVVENAEAISTYLTSSELAVGTSGCATTATSERVVTSSNANCIAASYTVAVDATTYSVAPTVTSTSSTADSMKVIVTWSAASLGTLSYTTSSVLEV